METKIIIIIFPLITCITRGQLSSDNTQFESSSIRTKRTIDNVVPTTTRSMLPHTISTSNIELQTLFDELKSTRAVLKMPLASSTITFFNTAGELNATTKGNRTHALTDSVDPSSQVSSLILASPVIQLNDVPISKTSSINYSPLVTKSTFLSEESLLVQNVSVYNTLNISSEKHTETTQGRVLQTSTRAHVLQTTTHGRVLQTTTQAHVLRTTTRAHMLRTTTRVHVLKTSFQPEITTQPFDMIIDRLSKSSIEPISSLVITNGEVKDFTNMIGSTPVISHVETEDNTKINLSSSKATQAVPSTSINLKTQNLSQQSDFTSTRLPIVSASTGDVTLQSTHLSKKSHPLLVSSSSVVGMNMFSTSVITNVPTSTTSPSAASKSLFGSNISNLLNVSHVSSTYSLGDTIIQPSLSTKYHQMTYSLNERVTVKPNPHKRKLYNFSFEIEFTGECKSLENQEALKEIWGSLMNIVAFQAGTKGLSVEPINILCGPLRLSFNVYNTTHKNLTEIIRTMIKNNNFVITVLVDNYRLNFKAIRIYLYTDHEMGSEIFLMGLNEVDIIVIICATAISVILVCAGMIICAREYYLKKRSRSFTLSSFMSNGSNSYDYTLTKIPRPNSSYSENGVRMKLMDQTDSQRAALLPIEEQETSVSDIQLRVNSNEDGIVVGVTGTGNNTQCHEQSYDNSDINGDQSEEKLCSTTEELDKSVDNPIYFADDERFLKV
ncbi:serine-rich adhesin for platelets-like [Mytilus edulis]|uniref:serine-rich adhesin for platelets-like n=1 Tax=Mytilus edulis TaxID=6550 RepID=UPI0039EF50A9